jgi:large subunit ribosomal protein L16
MGKGKGSVDHFMFRVSPGRIIFEVSGVPHDVAIRALQLATGKLPFKTRITIRPRIADDE